VKRAVLGALALVVAGVVSFAVFYPLGHLNGVRIANAILLLVGGCILAIPVIVLCVAARWRVGELLASIGLFEIAFGISLLVWVFQNLSDFSSLHGPGPVIAYLICLFFIGGGIAIPMLVGLAISQVLILWIDHTRSWRGTMRVVPAVAFLAVVLLLAWEVLITITGTGL
jgi:hypothetical protein